MNDTKSPSHTATRSWLKAQARLGRNAARPVLLLGLAGVLLGLGQALCAAVVLATALGGVDNVTQARPVEALAGFAVLALLRAGLQLVSERAAFDAGAAARRRLRSDALSRLLASGPALLRRFHSAELAAVVIDKIEAMEGFFANYTPAAVLAIAGPLLIVLAVLWVDTEAGLILAGCGLLVPLAMAASGIGAAAAARGQFLAMSRLQTRFLDRVRGIATIVLYNHAQAEAQELARAANELRVRTMRVLRVAFLSSAALDLAMALALVAIALRYGHEAMTGQLASGATAIFVLLAVPFFILVGYLMEANGMSVRLISLLQRGAGRIRGGLDVVMVLSMVIFSGISGSKMADIAAVGSVLVPAARKSGQKPGEAVALLAASAVMAETIPPCVNLIILGFVANLSIGGLFMAGLLPSALMAAALIGASIIIGRRTSPEAIVGLAGESMREMVISGLAAFGLIVLIFGGYRSGFATATEISAFAVAYALVVGAILFREMTWKNVISVMRHAAVRSGMVLFIVAAAQSLAYTLTLQQIPHAIAEIMVSLSAAHGAWLFLLLSVIILIIMGSVLEGAAALIIFGPLLMPVARQLHIDPLHYGVILVIGMGIGLFAPPLGLGLYGACLIGGVKLEETALPILKYLGILFVCLLAITFIPAISTAVPRALGY